MRARDIMVTYLITAGPDLDVGEAARIMVDNGISALPVVDLEKGQLLGIVSEGDLMRRAETGTQRRGSWWLELFASPQELAREYVRANARKVRDVMTSNVVVASPQTPLHDIATLLEKHNIKRVPIVDGDVLVGLVSRANLVQALASRMPDAARSDLSDEDLRTAVVANLRNQPANTTLVNVSAEKGIVSLSGLVGSEEERAAIRVAAEVTPGVRAVTDDIKVGYRAGAF